MSYVGGASTAVGSHKNGTAPNEPPMLLWALEYAEAGIPVFPCRPGEKRPCYEKGTLERGHLDATTDQGKIREWWEKWPEANIAVPTGKRSGWLVVDVDHPAGLDALEAEHGKLPATRTHGTGSGGMHLIYAYPEGADIRNSAGRLAEHLDIRGEGGYVVVPPSRTERPYEVLDQQPLADSPAELLEALTAPKKSRTEAATGKRAGHLEAQDGSILKGERHDRLKSVLGRAHDRERTLEEFTELALEINERMCVPPIGSPGDDPIEDVVKLAAWVHARPTCLPRGKEAPEEVQRALLALEGRLEDMTWSGHSSNALSLAKTCILNARKHGWLLEDGVAVSISNSQLALHDGVSLASVKRGKGKLKELGVIRTDNAGRTPTDSGTIVLLIPELGQLDNPTALRTEPTPNLQGYGVGEEVSQEAPASRGGRLTLQRGAWSAARARHGKPLFDGQERVGFLSRMGKRAEFAVDLLEGAGGNKLLPEDLASAMGIKRVRNMYARGGWLSKLIDAGVVEWDGEGYLSLTDDWQGAWDRRRIEGEEEMDRERDRKRYQDASKEWAKRVAEHDEERHQERLKRLALECFDGVDPETGEIVAERREVPQPDEEPAVAFSEVDPAVEGDQGHTEKPHRIHIERHPCAVHEPRDMPPVGHPQNTPRTPPLEGSRRSGDGVSPLAKSLRAWLERSPGDHPDRLPAEARRGQASVLANTVWAHSPPGSGKPTAEDVREALEELDQRGWEVAA